MRLHSSLVSLLFVCAGAGVIAQTSAAPTCADLHLVPAVRECTALKLIPFPNDYFEVSVQAGDKEDKFMAEDLEADLIDQARGIPALEDE